MVISVFLGGAIVWLLFFFGTKNMGENLGFFFLVIVLNNFTIFFWNISPDLQYYKNEI
jgi:hypothetical protein